MKQIIIYIIASLCLLIACNDDDYIFDTISTHRLNQYIDVCDSLLLNEEYGWKFIYYPDSSHYGAYTFLMKFEEGKRVTMICDLNADTSVSNYGFNSSIGPILSFGTYSLLHLLSDPNPDVAGGEAGVGYGGEYEFLISDVSPDCIKLISKKRKREAEIIPATASDWNNMELQREAIGKFTLDPSEPFYHYLNIGADTAFCYYSPTLRMAYLTYVENGNTIPLKLPVYSTVNGIRFNNPITFGGQTFSELAFNPETRQMSVVDEGVEGNFFRASDTREQCLLRFPNAVEKAKQYPGYSLIERGAELMAGGSMNLTPGGYYIEGFRFYWNLIGHSAGELYIREPESLPATYARLYTDSIAIDGIGDRVIFTQILNSYLTGAVTNSTNMWFGFTYSFPGLSPGTGGPLNRYLENVNGHTVIPVGEQFYMVLNDNNLAWMLLSPLVQIND